MTEVLRAERAWHAFGVLNVYPRVLSASEVTHGRDETFAGLMRERAGKEAQRWEQARERVR